MEGASFLDLCAGTGAVGIEALSRGAAHVTFVDRSQRMCRLVKANLSLCGTAPDMTEVVLSDAAEFLRRSIARRKAAWDVAFFDPPYAMDYEPVLAQFGAGELISVGGVLIVEHFRKHVLPAAVGRLRQHRVRTQGDSSLTFYVPCDNGADG